MEPTATMFPSYSPTSSPLPEETDSPTILPTSILTSSSAPSELPTRSPSTQPVTLAPMSSSPTSSHDPTYSFDQASIIFSVNSTISLSGFDYNSEADVQVLVDTIIDVASGGLSPTTQRVQNVELLSINGSPSQQTDGSHGQTTSVSDLKIASDSPKKKKKRIKKEKNPKKAENLARKGEPKHTVPSRWQLHNRNLQARTADYTLYIQELCTDVPCQQLVLTTNIIGDVTDHMLQEVLNGGFTAVLQNNARVCGDDCSAIQDASITGGTFDEENASVGIDTVTPTLSPTLRVSAAPSLSITPTVKKSDEPSTSLSPSAHPTKNPTSSPTSSSSTSLSPTTTPVKWFLNWNIVLCQKECEGEYPCAGMDAPFWADTYDTVDECCNLEFSYPAHQEQCKLASKQWGV